MKEHRCVDCGRYLPEGDGDDEVTFTCDPFSCEIYDVCEDEWRCGSCLYESSMDI